MFIIVGSMRLFPRSNGKRKIFCPCESCVRFAVKTRVFIFLTFFFIPTLPIGRVTVWNCKSCGSEMSPDESGIKSFILSLGSLGCASMAFLAFAWLVYMIIDVPDAFAPETIGVARVLLGLFALLAFLVTIVAVAVGISSKRKLVLARSLNARSREVMLGELAEGDDHLIVTEKLTTKGFQENQILALIEEMNTGPLK